MSNQNSTTIRISKEIEQLIRQHGSFGQTYDDVLRKLLTVKGARNK